MSRAATIVLAGAAFAAGATVGVGAAYYFGSEFLVDSFTSSSAATTMNTVRALNYAYDNDQKKLIATLEVQLGGELHFLEGLPESRRTADVNNAIAAAKEFRAKSIARGNPSAQ